MTKFNDKDLKIIFDNESSKLGIDSSMIEKDYYVFVVLDYLFNKSKWKDDIFFKGGTALSKCFGLINRFSEDIDLVIGWKLLGINDEKANETRGSKTAEKFDKIWRDKMSDFIKKDFAPAVNKYIKSLYPTRNDVGVGIEIGTNFSINVFYPSLYKNDKSKAIKPFIKIEIGPRSMVIEKENHIISPYIKDFIKNQKEKQTKVVTISSSIIFWEKVAILHEIAFLGRTRNYLHYSRHYYDLYCLYNSEIRKNALNHSNLVELLGQFRKNFFRIKTQCIDAFTPKSIILVPNDQIIRILKKDYEKMLDMIYKDAPNFDEILKVIKILQKEINSL